MRIVEDYERYKRETEESSKEERLTIDALNQELLMALEREAQLHHIHETQGSDQAGEPPVEDRIGKLLDKNEELLDKNEDLSERHATLVMQDAFGGGKKAELEVDPREDQDMAPTERLQDIPGSFPIRIENEAPAIMFEGAYQRLELLQSSESSGNPQHQMKTSSGASYEGEGHSDPRVREGWEVSSIPLEEIFSDSNTLNVRTESNRHVRSDFLSKAKTTEELLNQLQFKGRLLSARLGSLPANEATLKLQKAIASTELATLSHRECLKSSSEPAYGQSVKNSSAAAHGKRSDVVTTRPEDATRARWEQALSRTAYEPDTI